MCGICRNKTATGICRRCGKNICHQCLFHHGLCIVCARAIGKVKSIGHVH